MGLIGDGYFSTSLAVLAACLVVLVSFCKYRFAYWKRRGLPTLPVSIPFGNAKDFVFRRRSFGEVLSDLYFQAKAKGLSHIGAYLFLRPVYIPLDLGIVKSVLLNDSEVFLNRGVYHNENDDPLSANLFTIDGPKWRNLRQKLTQTFTTGQMRKMFQTMADTSLGLRDVMDEYSKGKVMYVKDILGCFTTDIISSCAFGISCNSLKDPDVDIRKYGKINFTNSIPDFLRAMLPAVIPHGILKALKFKTTRSDVSNFFTGVIDETIKYREANNVYRKDFMHLLLQLKNRGKLVDDGKVVGPKEGPTTLTFDELTAQAFVFFVAGFETSSTATSFALFELAENQHIQDRLREEINEVLERYDGKVSYDSIMEMTYMSQVLDESLRKYPPVPFLDRECSRDYKIPDTDLVLETGTHVNISVLGIHRDPDIYTDPETFDPERFTPENKTLLPACAFLPFGDGPRNCIGLRFGILQSKVALATMLKDHKVTTNSRTQVPLVIDKSQIILAANIWLNVERVK